MNGTAATVSVEGALREVDLSLIEDARLGDYVLIHAGFAIHKWDADEVAELEAIRNPANWKGQKAVRGSTAR